ncbi:hypothetical protein Pmani_010588 [Petrolisthes manimaculis]|uniref:Uncharacterized protein n=1 Tax=Petrolisthes manimaculis TaxID=1843537 RepID=A0AAE1UCI0_9EUCA|nr:hypothetical protein Pmani_010588 [Petrolisthes manimaculis]
MKQECRCGSGRGSETEWTQTDASSAKYSIQFSESQTLIARLSNLMRTISGLDYTVKINYLLSDEKCHAGFSTKTGSLCHTFPVRTRNVRIIDKNLLTEPSKERRVSRHTRIITPPLLKCHSASRKLDVTLEGRLTVLYNPPRNSLQLRST